MPDELSAIEELAARVGRLEAAQSVHQALNDYFYLLDSGRTEELLNVYTDEVRWSASNLPFGTGETLTLRGRAQVRSVVEALGYGGFRHHGMNIDVQVDDTTTTATTTAYMLVVARSAEEEGAVMLLGGLYEGSWVSDADRWRIDVWHVSNQWLIDVDAKEEFFDGLREGTQSGGRPRRQGQ